MLHNFDNDGFVFCRQLMKVAETELNRPLGGCRVLVLGEGAAAGTLEGLLEGAGALVCRACRMEDEDKAEIDIAFLLERCDERELAPLLRKGALVIDAAPQGDDTIFYNGRRSYELVRLIALPSLRD